MDISGIEYLGLKRVLERGNGEIIAEREQALLIRDSSAAHICLRVKMKRPACRSLTVLSVGTAGF